MYLGVTHEHRVDLRTRGYLTDIFMAMTCSSRQLRRASLMPSVDLRTIQIPGG
jgi:hypothetical protein